MALRGTLYRCHLFSFAGPQTEGVSSRWTQGWSPVGDRVIRSGEQVELYVKVDALKNPVGEQPRVRFDVLEEDYLLTGGLDDRVVTILGTDTPPPEEDFPVRRRITVTADISADETFAEAVERFKLRNPDSYDDYLLVYTEPSSSTAHIVTWFLAERVEDWANAELYFIINVDGRFEDQSDVISVSPQRFVPPRELPDISWPEIEGVAWTAETSRPGELVPFEIQGHGLQQGIHVGVSIGDEHGDEVDRFDVPILGRPPHKGHWRVPSDPGERYSLRANLAGRDVSARRPLAVERSLKFRLEVPFADGANNSSSVRYRVLDRAGTVLREGAITPGRSLELPDLPSSALELELEGVEITSVADVPTSAAPDVPPAVGRFFRIVELGEGRPEGE